MNNIANAPMYLNRYTNNTDTINAAMKYINVIPTAFKSLIQSMLL